VGSGVKDRLRPMLPLPLLELWRKARRVGGAISDVTRRDYPAATFALPTQSLEQAFPGISATPVAVDVSDLDRGDEWQLPLAEFVALVAICRYLGPRRIFELGTYLGSTTLAMARATPDDSEIFTLDLEPASRNTHRHGSGVGLPSFQVGAAFRGRPEARKIHQLFGDSRTFDFGPLASSFDLVFLDGDHTYEFVRHDTDMALRILRPGGTVVWDDYLWHQNHPECAGVTRCVEELSVNRPCSAILGTRLAVYRDRATDEA
jgi:predicted O-methyltransferase YrrM